MQSNSIYYSSVLTPVSRYALMYVYSLLLVRYLNFAAQSPLAKSWYSWHQKLAKIIYSRPSVLSRFKKNKKNNKIYILLVFGLFLKSPQEGALKLINCISVHLSKHKYKKTTSNFMILFISNHIIQTTPRNQLVSYIPLQWVKLHYVQTWPHCWL